jgi:hypothetical protein
MSIFEFGTRYLHRLNLNDQIIVVQNENIHKIGLWSHKWLRIDGESN